MDFFPSTRRGVVAGLASALLVLVFLLPACSDDPILGPDEGEPDDSGGSYSSIKRLAPVDSVEDANSPQPTVPSNPKLF